MDYLFINAIVKETYTDLACSSEFPASHRRRMIAAAPKDDFLDSKIVDSVFAYQSLTDSGRAPILMLTNVQRQKNCVSLGRYTQTMGWEWDPKLICADMDTIFGARFHTEQEILAWAENSEKIPLPGQGKVPGLRDAISMDPMAVRTIMTAVLIRWLKRDDPIRIAVPAGVDYNSYVWQAVRQIYAHFPVALRLEAGFCSYMPDIKKSGNRISIGFIPESMADNKTVFLDGSRRSAIAAFEKGTGRPMLDRFVEYLSVAESSQRQGLLGEVYTDVEFGGDWKKMAEVTARDYQATGEALDLLASTGGPDEMMPRWKQFFEEQEKYSPAMRRQVSSAIGAKVDKDAFCKTFRSECAQAASPEKVLEILSTYQPFCRVSKPLADGLWETALSFMHGKSMTYRKIHEAAKAAQQALDAVLDADKMDKLAALSLGEQWAELKREAIRSAAEAEKFLKDTENLYRTLANSQRNPHLAALLQEVAQVREQTDMARCDYIVADLQAQFTKVYRMPADSMAQMKDLIARCRKLLEALSPLRESDAKAYLAGQITAFARELQEKTGASDTKLQQLLDIIAQGNRYFLILDALDAAEKDDLDQSLLEQMHQALREKCPATLEAYAQEFLNTYERTLNLSAIAARPDFVCKIIVSDICRFNQVSVHCKSSNFWKGHLREMEKAEFAGGMISDNCAVDVLFQNKHYDGEWFRKLLMLEHTAGTMGDKEIFRNTLFALVKSGAYSGQELSACLKMLSQCNILFKEFFPLLIAGNFRDTTESQYLAAYKAILKYILEEKPDRKAENVVHTFHKILEENRDNLDRTAHSAFKKFESKYTGKAGGKLLNLPLPALIGIGVGLLAVIALVIVLIWAPWKDKDPEPTEVPTTAPQEIQETETRAPEETYVDPLHYVLSYDADSLELLYGANAYAGFDDYAADVTGYLNAASDEAEQEIILAYQNTGEQTIGLNDLTVSADEYFFWLCWFNAKNADAQNPQPFQAELYAGEVSSLLRAIHHNLPLEGPKGIAKNPATEDGTQDGTDVPPSEPASEPATEPASEPATEPTTAPTEALPSMEEILAAISEAARGNYELARKHSGQLEWMLKLFGKDFDKTFDVHQALVSDRIAAEKPGEDLLGYYNSVPGETVVSFAQEGLQLSWNEYAFWKYYLLASGEITELNTEQSHETVLEVLKLLHMLPQVEITDTQESGTADDSGETGIGIVEDVKAQQAAQMADSARDAFERAIRTYRAIVASVQPAG